MLKTQNHTSDVTQYDCQIAKRNSDDQAIVNTKLQYIDNTGHDSDVTEHAWHAKKGQQTTKHKTKWHWYYKPQIGCYKPWLIM